MQISTQSEACEEAVAADLLTSLPEERKKERTRSLFKGEDLANAMMIVLVPFVICEALLHSASKGFWFDEILTIVVSSQTHISGMWDLLKHGVDGHPLGFYLIEHAMLRLGGNERLVLRLPSIAAFFGVMACMFVFIRRRAGDFIAVISAASLLLTNLYDPFAFEARPYCLMVACIAVALLSYERLESGKWAAIFAVSLAAACSLHFYAALSFFPFGLAELTYWATKRRFRTRVWLAFFVGALPYFAFWPILRMQRVLYGAHFWSAPTFWKFARTFGALLNLTTSTSVAISAASMCYIIFLAYHTYHGEQSTRNSGTGFSLSDLALTIGFLAMPVVTFILAKIGHGGLTSRYVLTTTLGYSLATALVLSRQKMPTVLSAALIVLCMFGFQEAAHWRYISFSIGVQDPMQVPSQLGGEMDLPVVISDNLQYLPTWYHANGEFKARLFALEDSDKAINATGNDTPSLILITLRDYVSIQAPSFSDFARNHRKFLLYSDGTTDDYWPRWLTQRGYALRVVSVDPPKKGLRDDVPDPPRCILYFVDLGESK